MHSAQFVVEITPNSLGEKKNNVRAHGESGTDTDTETGTGMEKGAGKDLPACMSVR